MKYALRLGVVLLTTTCVGCTMSNSGGFILFPLPYKELEETKALKAAHQNPVVWPRELNKNVTGPAIAEPGDQLSIAAVDPAMRVPFVGEQPILIDGTIDLAKYGRVVVGYKTLAEIEGIINAALKANGGGALAITVRFARVPESKRVYVLGDVATPGAYPLNGNETVLDAILLAGGLTRKADDRNIILSRPTPVCDCRIVVPICHEEIVQWGDTATNYQLLPGDRIYVPTLSLCERIFGRKRKVCPPCGGYPTACALPEEHCENGCAKCAPGVGPVEVGLPPAQGVTPHGMTTPATPATTPANPAMGPRLEERRLPPPQSLRTPRGATALPTTASRSPAGPDFDAVPMPQPVAARKATMIDEPTAARAADPSGLSLPTRATAIEPIKDLSAKDQPATDWQSPWRPASQRTGL